MEWKFESISCYQNGACWIKWQAASYNFFISVLFGFFSLEWWVIALEWSQLWQWFVLDRYDLPDVTQQRGICCYCIHLYFSSAENTHKLMTFISALLLSWLSRGILPEQFLCLFGQIPLFESFIHLRMVAFTTVSLYVGIALFLWWFSLIICSLNLLPQQW